MEVESWRHPGKERTKRENKIRRTSRQKYRRENPAVELDPLGREIRRRSERLRSLPPPSG